MARKILIVTKSKSLVNDLAARKRYSSRFFLIPAHDLESAKSVLSLTKVNLVVTELGLPRLAGFRLLATLQSGRTAPPVVAVCDHPDGDTWKGVELPGVFKVVTQPVDYDALLETIHTQLDDFLERNTGLTLPPRTLLRLTELEHQSLIFDCRHERHGLRAMLYYRDGVLAGAHCDGLEDAAILPEIARWESATIHVYNAEAAASREGVPPELLALLGGSVPPNLPNRSPASPTASAPQPPPADGTPPPTADTPNKPITEATKPAAAEMRRTMAVPPTPPAQISPPPRRETPARDPVRVPPAPSPLFEAPPAKPDTPQPRGDTSPWGAAAADPWSPARPQSAISPWGTSPPPSPLDAPTRPSHLGAVPSASPRATPSPLDEPATKAGRAAAGENENGTFLAEALNAVGALPSLESALLVSEQGQIEEVRGALNPRQREEIGHAIRTIFSGADRVVGELALEGFQGLTLESDGHLISCWPMRNRFLAFLVSEAKDLGLIRFKMTKALPKLKDLAADQSR